MPFEHEGVDMLLLVGHGSECNSAGDVGSAVEILCSTIEQQQPLGFQFDVSLWRRFIMHDGTMGPISRNSGKGYILKQGLLSPKRLQFVACRHLCHSTFLHCRHKPSEEFHHCYSVTQHCISIAHYLGFVLHYLHRGHWRWGKHLRAVSVCLIQGVACLVRIHQYIISVVSCQPLFHIFIFVGHHTISRKMLPYHWCEFITIYI